MAAADARAVLDNFMTEKQFQQRILDLSWRCGWGLSYHPYDSRRSEPGFPDLVLISVERGRCIFVEVKKEKGKLAPEQMRWRDALIATGQRWYCWYPHDWDEVVAVLSGEGEAMEKDWAAEERRARAIRDRIHAKEAKLPDPLPSDLCSERECAVLMMRYVSHTHMTLAEVGKVLGVTRERVLQIERKALRKLDDAGLV